MANLLPAKERKQFQREYFFRVAVVVLVFLLFSGMLSVVLLLPSYFISKTKEDSIERQSALIQKAIALRENDVSLASLVHTKQKLDALRSAQGQVLQSDVIRTVVSAVDASIAVGAFYYTSRPNEEGELRITGRAVSRTSLIAFADRLKKESLFSSVDLPVSSLAQDSNIVFSITIKGAF